MTEIEYRKYPALSNSKLTWLKQEVLKGIPINQNAKYFVDGLDVDKLILQDGYTTTNQLANEVHKGFVKNCPKNFQTFIGLAQKQVPVIGDIVFEKFSVLAKCLHDAYLSDISIDIKTTECKSKQQFIEACKWFEYDRASWWYSAVSKTRKSWIIGVEKNYPYKVYFVDCEKDLNMNVVGRDKAEYLAYIYYRLFLI